ncbi:bifunctional folylpolyglutamate synthase/dihydrofolate synthase [Daejeonella sp.]|uniref:bifunctional folylpolyglutamate synthase/dihydrofolate synthase n=1 Tax=Daejeonella sp. TaxID=2805397 RepID=UPI0037837434
MNYKETIQYLYSRLPMFSKEGQAAMKPGLQNIIKFCQKLGNPEEKFKSVHVGGTNGKGSSSHMLAAILQNSGYKTGLYTSPHLRDFRERIRIDGKMISEKKVVQFVKSNQQFIEQIEPSFFEVTVAMAFEHFALEKVDIAIIEVGLGGRLDSTNIIKPELSLISNIGYDHMNILGNTLAEIALEKAGIIKSETPVIISQRQSEIQEIFNNKAFEMESQITFASDEWDIKRSSLQNYNTDLLKVEVKQKSKVENAIFKFNSLELDLTGSYQLKNLAGVLSAVNQLKIRGFKIDDDNIISALADVKTLTGLMGRWQTLAMKPLIICDTGHNEDGIKEVIKNIHLSTFNNLHMVIGVVKDKDISKILTLLPQEAKYYFCQPNIPRAKSANELHAEAIQFGLEGDYYESVDSALEAAKKNALEDDLIFIGGSTFVVAEIV